jgi:integrase/recombinase XerD
MPGSGELTANALNSEELIKRFFAYMRAERGAAENTVESYGLDLRKFSAWFKQPLTTVQRQDLSAYAVERLASGLSPRSVTRMIKTFRTFFRFLIDDEEIAHDPTLGVPLPKFSKRLPDIARHNDVDKMVASLDDSTLGSRDRAMLLLFFGSGLRESELANLKLHDIDLQTGIVKVWAGKGGKDAVLPLSDSAIEALKRYLEVARPKLAEFGITSKGYISTPYLFLGKRCGNRMTRQNVYYRVRDIASAALGRKVSPHQLRHGFATVLVENDADIADVQALMRHARVSTTQIYLHLDLNYLKEKYHASHPRARIADQNPGLFDALPGAKP